MDKMPGNASAGREQPGERTAQSLAMEALGRLVAGLIEDINSPVQYVGDNLEFLADVFRRLVEALDRLSDEAIALAGEDGGLAASLAGLLGDEDLRFVLEETPGAIEESRQGLDRVTAIVAAISRFAAPDAANVRAADVAEALDDVRIVSRRAWSPVAEVACDIEPELPAVACPPAALRQALAALLTCAATRVRGGGPGRMTVTARRQGGQVTVAVADSGLDGGDLPAEARPEDWPGLEPVLLLVTRYGAGCEALSGRDGGVTIMLTLPSVAGAGPAAIGA